MNKPKTKRGKSRTGWWLIERICLFVIAMAIFLFNCLSLLIPVHIMTDVTRMHDIASHVLVLLAMVLTGFIIGLYYHLLHWLERMNPVEAMVNLLLLAISFVVFCLMAAMPIMIAGIIIIESIFDLDDYGFYSISITFIVLTPQIVLLAIRIMLAIYNSVQRHNATVTQSQNTLTLP